MTFTRAGLRWMMIFRHPQVALGQKKIDQENAERRRLIQERNLMGCCVPANPVCKLCPESQALHLVGLNRSYFCAAKATSVQEKLFLLNRSFFCSAEALSVQQMLLLLNRSYFRFETEGVLAPSPCLLKQMCCDAVFFQG